MDCLGGVKDDVAAPPEAKFAARVQRDSDAASIIVVSRSSSPSPEPAGMALPSKRSSMPIGECDSLTAADTPTVSSFGSARPSTATFSRGCRPIKSSLASDTPIEVVNDEHERSRRSSNERRSSIEKRQGLRMPKCPMSTMPATPDMAAISMQDEESTAGDLFQHTFKQRRKSLNLISANQNDPKTDKKSCGSKPRVSFLPTVETIPTEVSRSGIATPASDTCPTFLSDRSPINFDNLKPNANDSDMESEGDSSSGFSSTSDRSCNRKEKDEVWQSPTTSTVEVPIWLLEKLQARGWEPPTPANALAKTHLPANGAVKSRPGSPDEVGNMVSGSLGSCSALRSNSIESTHPDHDTENKHPSSKRSCSKTASPNKPKSVQPMVIATDTFWKIPMPTRKNTMMVHVAAGLSDESGDEDEGNADAGVAAENLQTGLTQAAASTQDRVESAVPLEAAGHNSVPPAKHVRPCESNNDAGTGGPRRVSFSEQEPGLQGKKARRNSMSAISEGGEEDMTVRMLPKPMSRQGSRRPSVLSVFSDNNANAPGLYVLPKEEENTSEVVEVRRSSLVMSASMLSDILKSKVESAHMEDFSEQCEPGDNNNMEVVLPFFTPQISKIRECRCATDPLTGIVVHTCMTPSATEATNTEALQSFVCSEWNTRQHTVAASRASKSRRNSGGGETDDEDEDHDDDLPPIPSQQAIQANHDRLQGRKRIRNASMLQVVSASNPKAFTKYEAEEEPQGENELTISFKNILNASSGKQDGMGNRGVALPNPSCERRASDGQELGTGLGQASSIEPPSAFEDEKREDKIESELGHRFKLVEPYILAAMLKDPETRESLLIVDVRGRDWVGGHIPSSVNLRTSEVIAHPQPLILQCRQNRIHHIVFTCMYSVLRARKCAVAVDKAQEEERKAAGDSTCRIRISLLAGGMHAWVNCFVKTQGDKPPTEFLEHFDAEMWSDGGPSQGGLVHVMDALWSSGGQKALSDALSQELEQLLIRRTSGDLGGSRRQSSQSLVSSAPIGVPPELPVVAVPPPVAPPPLPPLDGILKEDAAEGGMHHWSCIPKKGSFAEAEAALDSHAECGMPNRSSGPRKGSFDETVESFDLDGGGALLPTHAAGDVGAGNAGGSSVECPRHTQPAVVDEPEKDTEGAADLGEGDGVARNVVPAAGSTGSAAVAPVSSPETMSIATLTDH